MASTSHLDIDEYLSRFDYALPDDLIAVRPPEARDGGRLLELLSGVPNDRMVADLPALLEPGDLLVVNNTRVLHARLAARRQSGGQVEVLLLGAGSGPVEAMVRPSRRLREGEALQLVDADGNARVGFVVQLVRRTEEGSWMVTVSPSPEAAMNSVGNVPLPPYLNRPADSTDAERYQTIFAGPAGAIAAPTAGLHLTPRLLGQCHARGIEVAEVTLHVGAGTFRNLRPEDLARGELHPETWSISEATADAIQRCRDRNGRVVAVGTTSTRTLESAVNADGVVEAGEGVSRLFIRPGFSFRVVDLLWTNLHLPRSSLLMLVCAFAGEDRVMHAYREAVSRRYRFFSYGDAMLVAPKRLH